MEPSAEGRTKTRTGGVPRHTRLHHGRHGAITGARVFHTRRWGTVLCLHVGGSLAMDGAHESAALIIDPRSPNAADPAIG